MSQLYCNRDLRPKPDFQGTLSRALRNLVIIYHPASLPAMPHYMQPRGGRARPATISRPSICAHAVPSARNACSPLRELLAVISKIQFKCCFCVCVTSPSTFHVKSHPVYTPTAFAHLSITISWHCIIIMTVSLFTTKLCSWRWGWLWTLRRRTRETYRRVFRLRRKENHPWT